MVPAIFSRPGFFNPDMRGRYKEYDFTINEFGKITIDDDELLFTEQVSEEWSQGKWGKYY